MIYAPFPNRVNDLVIFLPALQGVINPFQSGVPVTLQSIRESWFRDSVMFVRSGGIAETMRESVVTNVAMALENVSGRITVEKIRECFDSTINHVFSSSSHPILVVSFNNMSILAAMVEFAKNSSYRRAHEMRNIMVKEGLVLNFK